MVLELLLIIYDPSAVSDLEQIILSSLTDNNSSLIEVLSFSNSFLFKFFLCLMEFLCLRMAMSPKAIYDDLQVLQYTEHSSFLSSFFCSTSKKQSTQHGAFAVWLSLL